jgi:putative methyltransferase
MLKIYLCDLVYDSIVTNYVVPLNVAYIGACVKGRYADQVDITIFKYPKQLEEALHKAPPDILGLSHYSWNARLDILFLKMAKRLNADVITVMGGPHIRTDPDDIQSYLSTNPDLDYYIMYEGEEPFSDIVGEIIGGCVLKELPPGCAGIVDGEFIFKPVLFNKKPKIIDLPSPYLSGLLDPFLANPKMIPLLETNRGCPFGCVYCTWGVAALSKIRQRPLELIYEEIDYVAEKSVGQVNWIFCDANFGLLPRDVDIAKKIREVIDRKGYPVNVTLWHSKNACERNIEIVKVIGTKVGNIAIQSADPKVLKNCGRGNIKIEDLKRHVNYYKNNNLEVTTDILIGLPGESAQSHLQTLKAAFDIGFDKVHPYNIRMLPGSKYESDEYRWKYNVKTKYRPVFGAYGIYDGAIVFELEESVRATDDMTEMELDNFKVLHWLIYLCWNTGVFKPILRYGQKYGVNPCDILYRLSLSERPLLKKTFDDMKNKSMGEWFLTPREMLEFYGHRDNFQRLVNGFVKLNQLYIAIVYQNPDILRNLQRELVEILSAELKAAKVYEKAIMESLIDFSNKLVCRDFLQEEFRFRKVYPNEIPLIVFNNIDLQKKGLVSVEFFRPKEYVKFCNYHLRPNGKKDLSLQNLTRFLEIGGMDMLNNRVQMIN